MTNKKDQKPKLNSEEKKLEKRRKALKSILAGSGTVITAAAMQDKWAKPVIESVVLPAHAQTSSQAASFAATGIAAVPDQNQLLDTLVPSAHADLAIPQKNICINVNGSAAAVQVTLSDSGTVYTGNLTLPFGVTNLSPQDGREVTASGSLDAGGNSVSGAVSSSGFSGDYTALKSSASCQLTAPTFTTQAPPPTTTTWAPPPTNPPS